MIAPPLDPAGLEQRARAVSALVTTLAELPSNRSREQAINRMLQRGGKDDVAAVAGAVGMKVPKVFGQADVIQLARYVERETRRGKGARHG